MSSCCFADPSQIQIYLHCHHHQYPSGTWCSMVYKCLIATCQVFLLSTVPIIISIWYCDLFDLGALQLILVWMMSSQSTSVYLHFTELQSSVDQQIVHNIASGNRLYHQGFRNSLSTIVHTIIIGSYGTRSHAHNKIWCSLGTWPWLRKFRI